MRNDERKILEKKRVSLEEWLPDSRQWESYAVFGGDIFQRNIAVEQGIARCFGHRAIFVIHNNLSLEGELIQTWKRIVILRPRLSIHKIETICRFGDWMVIESKMFCIRKQDRAIQASIKVV